MFNKEQVNVNRIFLPYILQLLVLVQTMAQIQAVWETPIVSRLTGNLDVKIISRTEKVANKHKTRVIDFIQRTGLYCQKIGCLKLNQKLA